MITSYIALGSNLGDRRYYIESALRKIKQLPNTKVNKVSRMVETEPEGCLPGEGKYLNGVAEIETDLFPYRLLEELQRIENELGRRRVWLNNPRTIDLDIIAYGDAVISEEALCVPHPRMLMRSFVMVPLGEIAPGAAGKIRKLLAGRKRPKRRVLAKPAARRKGRG